MHNTTLPPVTVLYSTHRTTLKQLDQFARVAQDLYKAAAQTAFISGPLHWIYHGADGQPDTVFTLEIALPIQGQPVTTTSYSTKTLPPFKAVVHRHEGSFEQLPAAYDAIMQHIVTHKIPLQDECREIYLNIDWRHPENNITEIYVGII